MNILISTTSGHNVGDIIIALGVKRLLQARYGDVQYFEYNRNPDLQEGPDRVQRAGLVGNYWTPEANLLKHMDLVVLAGSPEWKNGPMQTLYQAMMREAPALPLLVLGIGLGTQWGTLTALDAVVLGRPETKITTRSVETTQMLDKYGIKSKALVCPALYAFDNRARSAGQGTLLILQKPGFRWHEIKESCLEGLAPASQTDDILCLHVKEFEYFSSLGYKPRYAASPVEFSKIVSEYDRVVSTRLHGAIGALSLGIPAVVVSDGDFRIETCASMFGTFLPVAKTVREALSLSSGARSAGLEELKQEAFDIHLKEIK